MGKIKQKSIDEAEAARVNNPSVAVPVKRTYKPVPKFNGRCPNC